MRVFIDNRLMQRMMCTELKDETGVFLKKHIKMQQEDLKITLNWSSLFKYIGLDSIFEEFPKFNEQHDLFSLVITAISSDQEKECIVRLYDQIFVECLTHVKAMSFVHPEFLYNRICKKRSSFFDPSMFSDSLNEYERRLIESPYNTIHDLILYLAWDRVCNYLSRVFEYVFPGPSPKKGLAVMKECLVESFCHITAQGKSAISFFKLVEAIYAYQMREENLQLHTDSEWQVLCEGLCSIGFRGDLSCVPYIDAALCPLGGVQKKDPLIVFTMDSISEVKAGLALGQYIIEKLRKEDFKWAYDFCLEEIICLKEECGGLSVDLTLFSKNKFLKQE